jgi:hypothetical protein
MYIKNYIMRLPNVGMGGSKSITSFEVDFWNNMFGKELPKYKDCVDVIFPHHPLETINLNIVSGHIFEHLQN